MKKCILIVPALEPRKDFPEFIDELLQLDIGPVLVVDDGSGKKYRNMFRAVNARKNCTVLYHEKNYGKGSALKTAIHWCMEHYSGYRGIITVDCDGQHRPKDVKAVYDEFLKRDDRSIVLGIRALDTNETPELSRLGNSISAWMMRVLYSIDLPDTQTGLRAFPASMVEWLLEVNGDHYEYELNVLIAAKKKNYEFVEVEIDTVYFRRNVDSHYRPFTDSIHIGRVMVRGLVKYFTSSLVSTVLDLSLFTLLTKIFFSHLPLSVRILMGTLIARVFSSLLNYSINRRLVFSQNTKFYPTMLRYYTVWVVQVTTSISFVWLLTALTGIDEVFVKMFVDSCLAIISYQVQLRWVFKGEDPSNDGSGD